MKNDGTTAALGVAAVLAAIGLAAQRRRGSAAQHEGTHETVAFSASDSMWRDLDMVAREQLGYVPRKRAGPEERPGRYGRSSVAKAMIERGLDGPRMQRALRLSRAVEPELRAYRRPIPKPSKTKTLSLPKALARRLDRTASLLGTSRSALISALLMEQMAAAQRRGSADKAPTFVVKNPKQGLDLIRHPDIVANFERGLRWKPKHGTAVLVPCAGTKPFPQAPSHKHGYLAAFEGKPVDLWVVSEPLGVVPYEFSREYPNDAYDFPPEHLTGRAHDELAKRVAAWFDRVAGKYGRIVAALPAHHQKLVDKGLGLAKSQHRIERAGVGPCRDEGACSTNTFRATAGDYKRWLGKKAGSKAQAAQQQWRHGCPPDYDQPFFHATTWDRLQSIAEDGLTPGGGSRFGGWYAGHSVGKVFVSQGSHTAFHWWSAVDRIVDAHQELRQQEDLDRVVVVMLRIDMKGIPLAQDRAGCIDEPCAFYTTESVGPERIWFYDGSNNLWRPIDEWDESDPAAAIAQWDLEWDEDEPEWQRQSWITFTARGPYADPHGPGAFAPPAYQDELVMAGWDEQMESW